MATLDVEGGRVHYRDDGRGATVLFLHAFPLGLAMWEPQVEVFTIARRTLRFDCRGFGASPPGAGPLTMDRIADDAAVLLDHLGIDRTVLCGLSMGGYAGLAFARRHPDRLTGLVLADTRAGADDTEARAARAAQADRVLAEGTAGWVEALLPRLVGRTTLAGRPQVVEKVRELALAAAPVGVVHALRGLADRPDSRPSLSRIAVPTLVVVGEEDGLTPTAEAEALHRAVPGSRLAVVPRAGHLSSLENPEGFNRCLGAFLDRLG